MKKHLYFIIPFIFFSCTKNSPSLSSDILHPDVILNPQNDTILEIPDTDNFIVFVDKSDHTLSIYKNRNLVKKYNCNIRNELKDRMLENDGQTPEGIFIVYQMAKVSRPNWKRWIAFDTLNKAKEIFKMENQDGEQILLEYEKKYGLITKDSEIRQFNKRNPKTPLLRGFGIHGGGYYPNNDWTLGCPALSDENVIELYDLLLTNPNNGIGTKIYIQD